MDADERLGHRRPWWQFNVVPLMAMLFALVWVRHLTDLEQLATIFCTLALVAGWFLLGAFGILARAIVRAGAWQRVRLCLYMFVPIFVVVVIGYRCRLQASLVEYVLTRRGVQPMVTFDDGISINMLRKDHSLRRYWGRVTGVRVRTAEADLLSRLRWLDSLHSLRCALDSDDLDLLARLRRLRNLELSVRGDVDFAPLRKLTQLQMITLKWNRQTSNATLESLVGLPVTQLYLRDGGLSDADLQTVVALPLATLELSDVQLSKAQEQALLAKGAIIR